MTTICFLFFTHNDKVGRKQLQELYIRKTNAWDANPPLIATKENLSKSISYNLHEVRPLPMIPAYHRFVNGGSCQADNG